LFFLACEEQEKRKQMRFSCGKPFLKSAFPKESQGFASEPPFQRATLDGLNRSLAAIWDYPNF